MKCVLILVFFSIKYLILVLHPKNQSLKDLYSIWHEVSMAGRVFRLGNMDY